MLDRLVPGVPAEVLRAMRRAAPVAVAAVLFAAFGAAWPLTGSPPPPPPPPSPDYSNVAAAPAAGAIDAFLAIARWGRAVRDPGKAGGDGEADDDGPAARGINPELARLGVIGIASIGSRHAVRLTKPGGETVRLLDGDALPDGRVLVSVSANSLVLDNADGVRQELLLFARPGEPVVADEPPADGEALP